ncbi:MAG: TadE/TadG family type IV pilus assembly protein, partial [Caulobacteraceae bacterium]
SRSARQVRLAAKCTGAAAAVEFALIAPVLILMYFGVAELTQGLICQRRVAHTADTIGDLVAQGSTTSQAEMSDIMTVGQTILAPFPTAPLDMRVSSITESAQGVTTVDWSFASGMTTLAKGAVVAPPSTAISPGQSVIMSEVQYAYTSPVHYVMPQITNFAYVYYLHPRVSDSVTCSDC